jgi:hypothetical protein
MGPSELLEHVVSVFERLGIPYLVTGSVAAMAYGEPRLTNGIDIVAGITERHISGLREAFPAEEYYLYEDAVRDAIRRPGQFNIIHPASGLKIDVIIRRDTPFDRSRFGRIRRIHPGETFEADFAALVGGDRWARFRFIEGDIRDLDTCHRACRGADYVLHEAALGLAF